MKDKKPPKTKSKQPHGPVRIRVLATSLNYEPDYQIRIFVDVKYDRRLRSCLPTYFRILGNGLKPGQGFSVWQGFASDTRLSLTHTAEQDIPMIPAKLAEEAIKDIARNLGTSLAHNTRLAYEQGLADGRAKKPI